MISIIIPLYNKENFIIRAIDSILSQTFQNFEIIIINDGSTDNSLQILKHVTREDKRVQVINKENKGVSSARNLGILKAKYPYIAFLDADDFYHQQFLETMMRVLEAHPEVEMITTKVSHSPVKKNYDYFEYKRIRKNDYFKILIRYHPIFTSSSTLIKKDLILKNKIFFDENLKYGEDTDFWNRCVKKINSDIILIFTKLACYDLNDYNTSISNLNYKSIQNSFFYKLLFQNHDYSYQIGEKEFIAYYIYKNYIYNYKSILKDGLLPEINDGIKKLSNTNIIIHCILFYLKNKSIKLNLINYSRLIYSKALNSTSYFLDY